LTNLCPALLNLSPAPSLMLRVHWRAVRTDPSIGQSYPDLVCSGNEQQESTLYERS